MLKFLLKFNDRFVSKWLVLAMDIFIVAFAFILATTIRFNLEFTYTDPALFKYHLVLVIVIKLLFFYMLRTYVGIVRHTNFDDVKQILKATVLSTAILLIISNLKNIAGKEYLSIPNSILFIDFFITVFGLVVSRVVIKNIFDGLLDTFKTNKKVVIYGAGHLGRMTKNTLSGNAKNQYKVMFFIDENSQKIGKTIEGIKVFSREQGEELLKNSKMDNIEVIFAIPSMSNVRRTEIVESLMEIGIPVRVVPPLEKWMNGELKPSQISTIKIEDLLERPTIQINNRLVGSFIEGKVVMVTGAAGSIGSEIVRQMLSFKPKEIILLDQAESPLYDLETELFRLKGSLNLESSISIEIKNITNLIQLEKIFKHRRPQVVFHAAAYKHVPLMENNPFKAIEVNSLGTQGLADLAIKYEVERFVFISTDKAVNPTNVMGASKRLAEIYVQGLNLNSNINTRFITTRFGNVLGSNGSVIPLFRKQIEMGGPVTVTHPDIIRYFMTIPEACQLVLEAGTMGKGGEIFVFDMGVPVRIQDLALKMIKLSGFEPHTQIDIQFTGLRAGEKLYEELLGDQETTMPTHHPKIMVAKVKVNNYEEANKEIKNLRSRLNDLSNDDIVHFLKRMIPEYISKNSPYETLDTEITSVEIK